MRDARIQCESAGMAGVGAGALVTIFSPCRHITALVP